MGKRLRGRIVRLFVAAVLALGLSACAANQLAVSGGGLKAMGESFVTAANLYNKLHEAGRISDIDYRKWALFARQFQVIFPLAVDTWQAVEKSPELSTGKEVQDLTDRILAIKQKLIVFYSLALSKLEVQ